MLYIQMNFNLRVNAVQGGCQGANIVGAGRVVQWCGAQSEVQINIISCGIDWS